MIDPAQNHPQNRRSRVISRIIHGRATQCVQPPHSQGRHGPRGACLPRFGQEVAKAKAAEGEMDTAALMIFVWWFD